MKNVADIKKEKNLNYILSLEHKAERNYLTQLGRQIIVVVHLHYIDIVSRFLEYLKHIPCEIKIVFTVSSDELGREIHNLFINRRGNCEIIYKQNRGRDISSFLVACREKILSYQYICFVHDKREKTEIFRQGTETWTANMWRNMLGSEAYMNGILEILFNYDNIGVLTPPLPMGDYQKNAYMDTWEKNYDNTKKLIDKLNVHCDISKDKSPVTLGTIFWAKVDALKKLLEVPWKYEDFDEEPLKNDGTISHAIERCLSYVAQDAGYDTGWVMTQDCAGEQIEYTQMVLKKAFSRLRDSLGIMYIAELDSYERKRKELNYFCNSYKEIYIYGAGAFGKNCLTRLKNEGKKVNGFLVSEFEEKGKSIQDIPVYQFSENYLKKDIGIIIAVYLPDQQTIIEKIKAIDQNFVNLYSYDGL